MRPEGCEPQLIRALASMPFLDRQEMVAVTGRSTGAVYEAAQRLEDGGFCASVLHAIDPLQQARRFHLTTLGLRRLAEEEDISVDALVRSRPLSAQWRRSLMERLDALPAVYRLASILSGLAFPIRFRWYRSVRLDAVVTLPDGKTVGIVRQGLTADRSGFAKRLWKMREEPMPGAVLILMADDVRLRHARRVLDTTDVPALFVLEQDALRAGADDPIWRPTRVAAAVNLPYVLERTDAGGEIPTEDGPRLVSVPTDLPERGAASDMADHLLPVYLKPAEKRTLDLVSDWPWITVTDLAGLLGVSVPRASQLVNPLEGFRLVARSSSSGMRLALTDRGLALLARRDRTSIGLARKRWSAAPEDPEAPFEWSNITGRRGRQLLRNAEHTAAVHGFLAALTSQAPLLGWEIVQFDPPRRASRHFRHDDRMRSVNPDAFGVLKRAETTWPFFLEWERRAVRPSTMSARLAPYLRYYSSHRPIDDHGARPAVLVVFDDEIAATHFLRVAREENAGRGGCRAPLGLPQRGRGRPGAVGTRLAHPRRVGIAPGAALSMRLNTTSGA